MLDENLALLRTRHKNVQRYRELLGTNLTDFEREYIGRRLSEEQASIDELSSGVPLKVSSASARLPVDL